MGEAMKDGRLLLSSMRRAIDLKMADDDSGLWRRGQTRRSSGRAFVSCDEGGLSRWPCGGVGAWRCVLAARSEDSVSTAPRDRALVAFRGRAVCVFRSLFRPPSVIKVWRKGDREVRRTPGLVVHELTNREVGVLLERTVDRSDGTRLVDSVWRVCAPLALADVVLRERQMIGLTWVAVLR